MKALVYHVLPTAVALLLGAAVATPAQRRTPRDRGGTSLLLEVKADASRPAQAVERTAAVIRKRCARLRIYCLLTPQPGSVANRLALRFSTASDPGRVKKILLAEGVELRAVVSVPHPFPPAEYPTRAEAAAAATDGKDILPIETYDGGESYIVTERAPLVTGDDLREPYVVRAPRDTPGGGYVVDSRLRPAGGARLKKWMAANLGSYVAVVFNGRALEVVYVKAPVSYNVVVSGGFGRRQAEDVAAVLAGGNLPAPVEVLEEGTYKP